MRNKLKKFLLEKTLSIVLKKYCPSSIPRTGKRAKTVDCFSAEIFSGKDHSLDILIDKVNPMGIEGRIWSGEKYDVKCSVSFVKAIEFDFYAIHFLGRDSVEYNTPLQLIAGERLHILPIKIALNRFIQFIYNQKTPKRTDRITLLNEIVELYIEEKTSNRAFNGDYASTIIRKMHGQRFLFHPEYFSFKTRFELILKSLVLAGDLKKEDHVYSPTGQALSTIANYEEENRRHIDQRRHNSRILWLTVVLAIVGLVQAYVAWNTIK